MLLPVLLKDMLSRKNSFSFLFFICFEIFFSQISVPVELDARGSVLCPDQYRRWELRSNVYVLICGLSDTKRFGLSRSADVLFEEDATAELPALIRSYIVRNYPQMKIEKSFLRNEKQKNSKGFRIEVGEVDLFFAESGEFLRYEVRK
jgi:hypothetical protein